MNQQAGEGFAGHRGSHDISMFFESGDYGFDGTREVGSAMPIGEEVDVAARPVAHAMGSDRGNWSGLCGQPGAARSQLDEGIDMTDTVFRGGRQVAA